MEIDKTAETLLHFFLCTNKRVEQKQGNNDYILLSPWALRKESQPVEVKRWMTTRAQVKSTLHNREYLNNKQTTTMDFITRF